MWKRSLGPWALAALLPALAIGCKQSNTTETADAASAAPPAAKSPVHETTGHLHWLGTKRLAADTNAASVLQLWAMPEAERLQTQTLDKLAIALASSLAAGPAAAPKPQSRSPLAQPGGASPAPTPVSSPAAPALRLLFPDLVEEEWSLDIASASNHPGEIVLSVRLSPERARVWETNLASAFATVPGATNSGGSSSLDWIFANASSRSFPLISAHIDRVADWTLLGLNVQPAGLCSNTMDRIRKTGSPVAVSPTNYWLETSFDLAALARGFSLPWTLTNNWPRITATVNGEGENVRTRGQLEFSQPLSIQLADWNIPTNLVCDPLIGFSAVRGLGAWLPSISAWKELNISSAPDQLFTWSQAGLPVLQYAAAYWPGAAQAVSQLSGTLQKRFNASLSGNAMGHLTNSPAIKGLIWENAPFVKPELRPFSDDTGEFVLAGLIPMLRTNVPAPQEMLNQLKASKTEIFYDWEATALRMDQVLYTSQLARLILRKAQLPGESASLQCLKAWVPKLRESITAANLVDRNRITFTRKSSIGFNAVELQLLADWLESPSFPVGLHTLVAPPPAPLPQAGSFR
jgi:hypothetical protein